MSARRALGAVVASALLLTSHLALACPFCAGRTGNGGAFGAVLIGALIFVPYPITAVLLRLIRRGEAVDREAEKPTPNDLSRRAP